MNGESNRVDSLNLSEVFNDDLLAEEYHNVDGFFNSYVAELTHRNKRQGNGGPTNNPKIMKTEPRPICTSAHAAFSGPIISVPGMAPMAQLPTLPGAMAVPLTQQAVGTLPPDVLSTLMGQQQAQQRAFAMATGAVARPLMPAMAPEPQIAQPNGFSIAPFVFEAGMDSQHSGGSGARFKSHKQQEANKIAQQRYRERKKQKFSEMERTVGELQQQLAALQSMQQRNKILEGMNSELQKQLVDREREVERLKIVLDEQADATLVSEDSTGEGESPSAGGGDAPFYTKPLPVAEDGMVACVPCDILPRDLNNIDFKAGFADQMAQLKDFVTKHGLDAADAMGINVPPEVIRELGGIVGRCCQLCQAAIRSEGVKILELISRDPKSLSNTAGAESSQWLAALDAVQLTPSQQEQLLLLRRSHLDRMREIYAERQALNMEAMVLMLPHHSANPGEDNTVEGKMNNISTAGYLPVAKSNAELATVLDKIKNNLRREQRSVMDLNCCTISRIMNPVQAARYMITVYPRHCDALALSNVLAQKVGREGSFSRLASEALASSGSGAAVAVPAGGGCCGGTSACC